MKPSKKAKAASVETAAPRISEPVRWAVGVALALVPCFWQSRIQANDLGSHIYNTWLAHLVEAGQAPGLTIVSLKTNVLFDVVLKVFFEWFGADMAQRIAVSGAALIMVSGAFAFVRRLAGRPAWPIFPVIVMLAYGWTFHMGLFNFYTSLGLTFWAMSLAWKGGAPRLAGAAALLVLAYVAHGLPVAWAVAVLAYRFVAERLDGKQRIRLLLGGLAAIAIARIGLQATLPVTWFSTQIHAMFGSDQLWVYDLKTVPAAIALFAIWVVLALPAFRRDGLAKVAQGIPFQLSVLAAFGIVVIPSRIMLPGFGHPLVYLSDRMSLALAVCICAFVAGSDVSRRMVYVIGALSVYFFGCVYADENALNRFEDDMTAIVRRLPPGQRVLGPFASFERIDGVWHAIDRVCIGHCYSYGNYEPSSGQFRVRATGPNPIVLWQDHSIDLLMLGTYAPKPEELPVYEVYMDDTSRLNLRSLGAGDQSFIFKSHLSTNTGDR